MCQYQATLLQIGLFWGVVGDALIGISLLLIVVKHVSLQRIRQLHSYLFIAIAVAALLNGIIPLLVHHTSSGGLIYAHMVGWCWITSNYTELQFILLHLPICLVFLSNTVLFLWVGSVYYRVYKRMEQAPHETACKETAKLCLKRYLFLSGLFTIIYMLCWLSVFINRLLEFAGITVYFMFLLRNICTPLRGIFDLVLFAFMTVTSSNAKSMYGPQVRTMLKLHIMPDDGDGDDDGGASMLSNQALHDVVDRYPSATGGHRHDLIDT
ncbi:hypothetical protein SYNPS1DRAFT_29590 [Syncephalis pseudoplumigaleata]|uniref:G-protein coupled receptors family 2 profile 2 domain-containing protein n=1 Tax=Syncephalis pseudoplumigaleata TaxID=1712513 RepID=A0A4P9YYK4_9FUNG|nr:hypothetical protein SYNPS1DRAFT_29590 [Syncephalis pseudoplumigaleata]|eukprot:RKP24652.1 hypothetical protein SYNPS1DRAFT_29590 [Syncephalis pseudoplumigaleata]